MFIRDDASLLQEFVLVDVQRLRAVEAASDGGEEDLVAEDGSAFRKRSRAHASDGVDRSAARDAPGLGRARLGVLAESRDERPMQTDAPEVEVRCVSEERARHAARVLERVEDIPGAEHRPEARVRPCDDLVELPLREPEDGGLLDPLLTGLGAASGRAPC